MALPKYGLHPNAESYKIMPPSCRRCWRASSSERNRMTANAIATLLTLCALSTGAASAQNAGADWRDYLGRPDGSHYSPLTQINVSNVNKIDMAWSYPAGDGMSVFCPLVVDNIAYIAAKGGALVALDATTGKELWAHSFGSSPGGRGGIGGQRGANYWESADRKDRRIFVTS